MPFRFFLLTVGIAVSLAGSASAQIFTNLYSFAGGPGDGADPSGGLLLLGDTLFGTTRDGGSGGNGTIFKINTNGGAYSVFTSFSATVLNTNISASTNKDGAGPSGSLVAGGAILYGGTSRGGTNGNGVIFSIGNDGAGFGVLKSFSRTSAGTNDDGAKLGGGLTLVDDTLYGTTYGGGDFGNGTLFAIKTNGTGYTVLRQFSAASVDGGSGFSTNSDGYNSTATLLFGGGSLYGTASLGGSNGSGTIFKISTNGSGFTVLKAFERQAALYNTNSEGASPSGTLVLSGNTLYGITSFGGAKANGTIFKLDADGTGFTVLKTFSALASTTNIDGAFPAGVVLSGDTLYGTAAGGGVRGNGTLFAIKTNGSGFVVLRNFSADEGNPSNGLLLQGSALYGFTQGGTLFNGSVFGFQLPDPSSPATGALQVALGPPEAVTAGAQWQLDGGSFLNNGAILSGIAYGNHTLSFKPVSGWATPLDKLINIAAGVTNTDSGTYTPPQLGALQVTLTPPAAVTAGAQWSVDGGSFQNSGSVVTGLAAGNHVVTFATISGWVSPGNQIAAIGANFTNNSTYAYSPNPGNLQVTITPPDAVTAGALWQVDGQAFQSSGAIVTNLSVGDHTVAFKTISGWFSPGSLTVGIRSDSTTNVTGNYSQLSGALKVNLSPAGAISAGARWQVDGGALQVSGAVVNNLSAGDHTIGFNSISGWLAPSNQLVTINANVTNISSATYTSVGTGALKVNLSPAGAVTAGAKWSVDGGALQTSGAVVTGLAISNHTISFTAATGFITPIDQNVAIILDHTNTATGTYTTRETTKPTLAILSPKPSQRWSNELFTVTGTAKDNIAVASVFYQFNTNTWANPITSNNYTNWNVPNLQLMPGTNVISAYAVDTAGNRSITNTVKFIYVLSDRLTVQAIGRGTISPNYSNAVLEISKNYSMTATAATGFKFTNWSGSIPTNTAKLFFNMQSNLSFTANFVDVTRPVNVILAPKPNQRWSNELFTVTGTAKDNVGVTNVWYQLNNSGWSNAITVNHWTNWMAPDLLLTPGTNTISTYAADFANNRSLTNTILFKYVLSDRLIVSFNGKGTLSPNYSNAFLEIGRNYSMIATAATGFRFINWTGSFGTNNVKIIFNMQSNLSFTANFLDIARPLIGITVPKVNQKWSNVVLNASGKATDNVGVTNVWYELNGTGWNLANLALDRTNWSTPNLTLLSGSNQIQSFALDAVGNVSLTNKVNFTYIVLPTPDWAPDSLNGLLAQVTLNDSNPAINVSFDISTFAQMGEDTNADNYGVGTYLYNKTATNLSQVGLVFTLPANVTNQETQVSVIFTNYYSGYFTNEDDGGSGGIKFLIATNFLPGTLIGKTLIAIDGDTGETNKLKLINGVGFTKSSSSGGTNSGTYTFTRFSPVSAMLACTFTNATDLGRMAFVQTTFTNATGGRFFFTSFDNLGVVQNTGSGKFKVQ